LFNAATLEFIEAPIHSQSRFKKQKKTPETLRFQASLPVLLRCRNQTSMPDPPMLPMT